MTDNALQSYERCMRYNYSRDKILETVLHIFVNLIPTIRCSTFFWTTEERSRVSCELEEKMGIIKKKLPNHWTSDLSALMTFLIRLLSLTILPLPLRLVESMSSVCKETDTKLTIVHSFPFVVPRHRYFYAYFIYYLPSCYFIFQFKRFIFLSSSHRCRCVHASSVTNGWLL